MSRKEIKILMGLLATSAIFLCLGIGIVWWQAANAGATGNQTIEQEQVTQTSNKETTSDEEAPAGQADAKAILGGDFSSIAGSWKDEKGRIYTFDKTGLISYQSADGEYLESFHVLEAPSQDKTGIIRMKVRSEDSVTSDTVLQIVPKGKRIKGRAEGGKVLEFAYPDTVIISGTSSDAAGQAFHFQQPAKDTKEAKTSSDKK